ncbi:MULTISPECIES: amidohydrolase family protein [Streptomyces]|uniref:Amidohydrolase n=2 Tax=Streptomyces TaxID=1883 RepID=B1W5Y0_STRGG|nr:MULTISPECIES: amidohydrolase family protein [Streptomyces]BAG23287.1 putative amidohydrolase [Streptomyces griseus subsp. griseus NBRC 13350]SCD36876.1 Cytosine/adenosine deaminase [Streptomyces sp. OspMP-M43]SEE37316.1 Cytosine/adenosine deaminase [Streptomyces griseus]
MHADSPASRSPGPSPRSGPTGDPDRTDGPARVTVFTNVRPYGAERPVDLTVVDGVITADPAPHGAQVVDCEGRIALPTLVDAHIHPDKTAWGEPWVSRDPASTIAEYTAEDVKLHHALRTPLKERAERLMGHAVARGTRAMRAHVDVAPAYGLAGVEGVGSARGSLRHALDVEIVAFPQHGVIRTPGTEELLEEAARTGAVDRVGGIDPIGFDGALDEQLDIVFGIADRHGVGVDIHLHERAATGLESLRAIIDRTRALSLRGKVTVSHVFCVPGLPERELDRLAADLADAGISLTTVAPSSDLVLPIGRLREHGVTVGLGSDGVRDSWSPFGNADMLHRSHLLARVQDARLDEELEAAFRSGADGGARLLGLPEVDLGPGSPADFLLVRGECLPQVVVDLPHREMVVRGGRIVARDGELVGR